MIHNPILPTSATRPVSCRKYILRWIGHVCDYAVTTTAHQHEKRHAAQRSWQHCLHGSLMSASQIPPAPPTRANHSTWPTQTCLRAQSRWMWTRWRRQPCMQAIWWGLQLQPGFIWLVWSQSPTAYQCLRDVATCSNRRIRCVTSGVLSPCCWRSTWKWESWCSMYW